MAATSKQIIIIKKKGGHGGHHGGAWKVAYADFVTAMMSLFIVLWLMNTSEKVRQAVAGYFNDPRGKSTETGTDQSGTNENLALTEKNIPELKKKIEEAIRKMNDLKALQNQIQITITPEGLRIELLETKDGTFFDTGSARLNGNGEELLKMLAGQLGDLPNQVSIEGHTDAQPYASKDGYGNWDLSTDRANAARRVMQISGLRENQVSQVRGYADQKLRVPSNPLDPSNRRISLIVQYLTVDAPPVPAGKPVPGLPGGGALGPPTVQIPAPAGGGAGQGGSEKPPAPAGAESASAGGGKAAAAVGSGENAQTAAVKTKPAAGKPAVSATSAVARLWQKIHRKK
ncbi:MAG TPA: flagellar motor protein MotB [Acidobacteriaceae bacterium]|jgi:chemotaxis protein MotB|nr:flagellar motor protein MotB [Acidobacteriaceae bacterium]